jgi:ABC-type uncharacterized transport system involved in gliding motility auxiliary subunit
MFLLVIGAGLVLLNVLGVLGASARVDTTESNAFSLSEGSKRLAKSLEDQMEIRAYFSEELPPPYNAMGRYVRDLLTEYRDASGGKITLKLVSPKTEEEKKAAEADGVMRVADQKLEADSFGVQEGYRGISLHYMGDSKALPRVDTTAGLEYEVTQLIKQMVGVKTKIGVLGGHDGATPAKGLANLKEYMPSYEMTEVQATKEIDPSLKALLIVHPETPLTDVELKRINQFVMRGGSLGVFGGGIKLNVPDQQQGGGDPSATPIDTGLNKLLERWGLTIDNRIVADAQCGRARMPTQIPGLAIPVPYPPVPIVSFDEQQREHPALFRMNQIGFPYPVRLALNDNLKGDKQVKTTQLVRSTANSWLMEGDTIDLKARERWDVPGYNGPYTLGVALEGKLPSAFGAEAASAPTEGETPAEPIEAPDRASGNARVLVFGTGYFLRDEFLPKPERSSQAMGGAVALGLNAIDWLTQDNDLIAIRAKNIEDRMLEVPQVVREAESTIRDAVEAQDQAKAEAAFEKRKEAIKAWDARKNAYRWGNTLAIPAAFAVFGLVRWRVRAARKARLTL